MLKMTIDIAPVPASRPRVTRFSTYFPKKYTKFRNDLAVILSDKGYEKLEGLLYVKLDFYVQIPKSWSKKKTKEMEGRYCSNNADIDNYCKAVLDGCEGVFYENDKQVVMIRARKFYSINGRIQFELSPIVEEAA